MDEGQEETAATAQVKQVMAQLKNEAGAVVEQEDDGLNPHALIRNGLAQYVDLPMDMPSE